MPERTLARRDFLSRIKGNVPKVVSKPPEKADQTAMDYPGSEITLSGGLNPYTGPWTYAQAAHLLRRTTFGVKKNHLDQFTALGNAENAVNKVLEVPLFPPPPPINNYNGPDFTDPVVQSGETWINAVPVGANEGYRIESWRGWWTKLMINGDANILEKMTLFWHNHFATQTEAVFLGKAIYRHNSVLRNQALGNFKGLVKAVTLDPCMLYYLNGHLNDVSAPDENYARELQELFTVGKDSGQTYTENDVKEAARVLTGWRVNYLPNTTYFNVQAHDKEDKQFSEFYGNKVIEGKFNGEEELDDLLDMIFEKDEVALFICRKIYRFFVYYKIDDVVENDVIVPLAEIFRANNYDIKPVMKTLLLSEHFFDAYNKGCYIKTPLDHTLGLLRNFKIDETTPTLYDDFVLHLYLNYYNFGLQMMPGEPPNVAGWIAFRQAPGYYRNWINGDTIRNRNIYSDVLSFLSFEILGANMKIDHIATVKQFDNPEDPNLLIDDLLKVLLPMEVSTAKKTAMKSILLSNQANDYYWTQAWEAYEGNPNDQMAYEAVWFRLALLHKYIMNIAEYQLI